MKKDTWLLKGIVPTSNRFIYPGTIMVICSHSVLVFLICMGLLLAAQPDIVSGLQSIDFVLRHSQHNQDLVPQNQRILLDNATEGMNTQKKSTQINNTFDPNQSSKRRVRRGSDPIHNRS
ncbi:hypothetical protein QYF36_011789 [Acer negundo]|nr:hypothetical protein QYF36_011789 [Acer negundo]